MKIVFATLFLSLTVTPAFAQKSCEELKSEIAAKLDAKGVKNYLLEIVAAADLKDQTVVGSCEFGAKKIVYKKAAKPEHAEETPAVPAPGRPGRSWRLSSRMLPPLLNAPAAPAGIFQATRLSIWPSPFSWTTPRSTIRARPCGPP